MNILTYRITLDAHKNGIQRTLQGFQVGENLARQIRINLVSNSESYELPADNSVVAMMYITKPGAAEQSINACTIVGNTIVYDVLPNDVEISGMVKLQLKLIKTSVDGATNVLIAPAFAMEVSENDVIDSSAEASTTFTALENAIAQAQAVYNSRIVDIEIAEDMLFVIYYADDTTYESDVFTRLNEAEQARVLAEQERVVADLSRAQATEKANKAADRANTAAAACEEIIMGNLPVASETTPGAVKADGETLTVDVGGKASVVDSPKLGGKLAKEYATYASVKDEINAIVDGAPEAMDTLKKVADATNENKEVADALKQVIAEAYDATATYVTGSYCIHENILYKSTVDITESEEFNAEHWKQTTVMAEIAELKASLGTQMTYTLDGAALTMTTK